jgi:hypothetical protein
VWGAVVALVVVALVEGVAAPGSEVVLVVELLPQPATSAPPASTTTGHVGRLITPPECTDTA